MSEKRRILLQVGLFIVTFITTTFAGGQWVYGTSVFNPAYTWADFVAGLAFSVPLLLILTVHEFGHYFVALFHKVKTSLPYYIPIPPIPYLPFSIGTLGAVIRLRSRPKSNLQNFDIGLAGPLAGFVVALGILFYAFQTLPPVEYVFQFHPEYEKFGAEYAQHVYSEEYVQSELKKSENKQVAVYDIQIGSNLLFWIFGKTVADPSRIPNAHEIMHYPVILACYIPLFVTCLNLLPIGQLDGGHVVYGLFGFRVHRMIASIAFVALLFYAGLGLPFIHPELPLDTLVLTIPAYVLFLFFALGGLNLRRRDQIMYALLIFAAQFGLMAYAPGIQGYQGWLLFAFIVGRFVGVEHPPSEIEHPLDAGRTVLGWVALIVFALCFSPAPLTLMVITAQQ